MIWDSPLRQGRILVRHIRFGRLLNPVTAGRKKMAALETLFVAVNRWLQEAGVEYWLVYGTLLGYFREGGILAHDTDIDIGAREDAFTPLWRSRHRLPAGFRLYDTTARHRGPKLYVAYQGWEADIYFYEEVGGRLRSYEKSQNPGETTPFPVSYIFPLRRAVFIGQETFVPNRPRAYLEHVYRYIGPDAVRDCKTGYWRKRS